MKLLTQFGDRIALYDSIDEFAKSRDCISLSWAIIEEKFPGYKPPFSSQDGKVIHHLAMNCACFYVEVAMLKQELKEVKKGNQCNN